MDIKEVTLDSLISNVQEKEAKTQEPAYVTSQIKQMCSELKHLAQNMGIDEKARILTDYDADGICSAMIMKRTLECMNPEMNIEVVCNDRRGSYGVPKDTKGESGVYDIVLDMGSNELGYIQTELDADRKNHTLILDHHQIEGDIAKKQFRDNPKYLNPHCATKPDGKTAEYCATGLAYRCFQELANDGVFTIPYDEKIDRTVAIYAAIGTATDVMPLLDEHSYNREIMKKGIEYIDTANPQNTDYILGAMLETVGISEHTTAHEIAYNAGAYLNAASRMSEVTQTNGAQQMFDMLADNPINDLGREPSSKVGFMLDDFKALNELKKAIVQCVMNSDEYKEWETAEKEKDTGISVFVVPEGLKITDGNNNSLTYNGKEVEYAHAIDGLIAGKAEDTLDKAVIVLSKKGDEYTGSGRAPEGYDSLNKYMAMALQDAGLKDDVKFGGHDAAIGVSSVPSDKLQEFIGAVEKYAPDFQRSVEAMTVLKLTENEIANPDLLLSKIQALEPVGQGNKVPPAIIEGTVEKVAPISRKANANPKWQNISVKTDVKNDSNRAVSLIVKDWNYPTYPSEKKEKTSLLADIGVSQFKGSHIELAVRPNARFAAELTRETEKPKGKQANSPEKG